MAELKAKVSKDRDHPDSVLPWVAKIIDAPMGIRFSTQEKAMDFAYSCVWWMRDGRTFSAFVLNYPEKLMS